MRMKMFAAETFEAAKAMIFAEMGADAVILSEREIDGGVEVRAAVDKMGGVGMVPNEPLFMRDARGGGHGRGTENPLFSRVRDALLWHGAPQRFADRVAAEGAGRIQHVSDPEEAIAEGLARIVTCDPLPARLDRDVVLVGPPGHGRTATAAKLTRRAAMARAEVAPVAADLDGTAGGDQLAAYLELEKGQIRTCHSPDDLFATLRALKSENRRCVIDLPAINPFDDDDMASLQDLISVIRAEPVLVMSAEGHPDDQSEAARGFARAGVKRAILTKLDVVRRRGGAISALSSAGIAFSHLAVTPFIGGGLVPAAPMRLAALLMEDAPGDVIALKGAA
ncbi:flagellar biosynthesis protein FlhF [Hyphomonas jannaschiana]|uniref:Flagellar biosynthesis protein FlhF-like protein n=1 Tax=Hyphomonas jannaschiana VP2 TaxID=1280952 RepID=A0A059FF66_9PROT|nr:flagellar biosynthesis protein FlhF [Hyphomonas jannaschiana]KCZ89138.1 flagellar biosynthesis protein FlhF-like protein [Hyphomonas jannaschiana VP2]